jgi:hypothetical protein
MKGGERMHKNAVDWIALILLIIGGLNWGLVGIWNFNLVTWIFGAASLVAKIIYVLVGFSALWMVISLLRGE